MIKPQCAGFAEIRASRADSTDTLKQVLAHNEMYRRYCKAGQ